MFLVALAQMETHESEDTMEHDLAFVINTLVMLELLKAVGYLDAKLNDKHHDLIAEQFFHIQVTDSKHLIMSLCITT